MKWQRGGTPSLPLLGMEPWLSSPYPSHYTDWGIPALLVIIKVWFYPTFWWQDINSVFSAFTSRSTSLLMWTKYFFLYGIYVFTQNVNISIDLNLMWSIQFPSLLLFFFFYLPTAPLNMKTGIPISMCNDFLHSKKSAAIKMWQTRGGRRVRSSTV
jgi:hypothetical protein